MEAVAANALGIKLLRNRVVIGLRAMAPVERGVEARHLRQVGKAFADRADRRQIVGLVQRRKRHIARKISEHLVIDQDRAIVGRAAMDDAMADRDGLELAGVPQPDSRGPDRGRNVRHVARGVLLVDQRRAVRAPRAQPWPHADTVHLAPDERLDLVSAGDLEDLELDAR